MMFDKKLLLKQNSTEDVVITL